MDAATLDRSSQLRVAGMNGYGFISVSKHGYLVLNANKVFFGDIDCEQDPRNPEKVVANFQQAAEGIERVAKQFNLTFRVYGTFAGLRLIEVSQLHDPESLDVSDVMKALNCDPAFIALTARLKNFRVRLTPKPWRAPEGPEKIATDAELDEYLRSGLYAVAHYIGTIGAETNSAPPAEVQAIVNLHDAFCRVTEELPLA